MSTHNNLSDKRRFIRVKIELTRFSTVLLYKRTCTNLRIPRLPFVLRIPKCAAEMNYTENIFPAHNADNAVIDRKRLFK